MADDWEDWEEQEIKLPAKPVEAEKPLNPLLAGLDLSKFADEDAEIEKEEKKHAVPTSQPKKKEEKKYLKESVAVDVPLDDPAAEKARRQRLQEEQDLAAARDLFDGAGEKVNLDALLPKTVKDFEEFAGHLASRYITVHKESKNYKAFLKALVKLAVAPLTSTDTKEIEQSLGATRAEKHKAEQAELAAKKNTKKNINLGKGGDLSAGLDDYIYDDAGQGDDFDFM